MKPIVIDPTRDTDLSGLVGAVLCENVRVNERRFRKGDRITSADLQDLALVSQPVVVARLDADEVHEDEAGSTIARAVAGHGLDIADPKLSRVNLNANRNGLLRIDKKLIDQINSIQDVGMFTLIDRLAVSSGTNVAAVKVTPVAIKRTAVDEVVRIASSSTVCEVKSFQRLRVGIVSTEGMNDKARAVFEKAVRGKVEWYCSEVAGFTESAPHADAVAAAIKRHVDDGCQLVMTGGGNTINPLDPAIVSLERLGADLVRSGVPVHPGSMFWLAYWGDVPIVNLASCSMYSQSTSADLVLPWIMAGEKVTPRDLASLGYGGLLDKGMDFRFPPYGESSNGAES